MAASVTHLTNGETALTRSRIVWKMEHEERKHVVVYSMLKNTLLNSLCMRRVRDCKYCAYTVNKQESFRRKEQGWTKNGGVSGYHGYRGDTGRARSRQRLQWSCRRAVQVCSKSLTAHTLCIYPSRCADLIPVRFLILHLTLLLHWNPSWAQYCTTLQSIRDARERLSDGARTARQPHSLSPFCRQLVPLRIVPLRMMIYSLCSNDSADTGPQTRSKHHQAEPKDKDVEHSQSDLFWRRKQPAAVEAEVGD